MEENRSDERTVAVTIQESLDGIHEKAMACMKKFDEHAAVAKYDVTGRHKVGRH